MYCGACGTRNKDQAVFCAHCWKKLTYNTSVKTSNNFIGEYISLWVEENKKDLYNRISVGLSYLDHKDFRANIIGIFIVSIFLFSVVFFPESIPVILFPIGFYVASIIAIVSVIDLFLGRFVYLFKWADLKGIIKSSFIEKVLMTLESTVISDDSETFKDMSKDYMEKKMDKLSFKNKFFHFVRWFLDFHTKLAKKIIVHSLVYLSEYVLPHTDFNSYVAKIAYFILLPFKKLLAYLAELIKRMIEWLISRIVSIIIFIVYILILWAGIALVSYAFMSQNEALIAIGWLCVIAYVIFLIYKYIRKFIEFIIWIIQTIKWIIVSIIRIIKAMPAIIIAGVLLYFTVHFKLYYLLIAELVIIGISVFLILKNIFDDFLGISLFKSTYGYAGGFIFGKINLGLWYFILTLFVMVQNNEVQESILNFIQGNYNTRLFALVNGEEVVQTERSDVDTSNSAGTVEVIPKEITCIEWEGDIDKNRMKEHGWINNESVSQETSNCDEIIQARKNELKLKIINKIITQEEKEELILLWQ